MTRQALLFTFIAYCLSACSISPVSRPEVKVYTLLKPASVKTMPNKTHKTLLVSTPKASPNLQGADMVYVNQPYQLKTFTKNRWVASPSEMLTPLLVSSLRHTHYFHAVVSPPFGGLTDYRLDTYIMHMQQEFLTNDNAVRITLNATLYDNHRNRIIASRDFMVVVKTDKANPYGGVVALNEAQADLLSQVAHFTTAAISRQS